MRYIIFDFIQTNRKRYNLRTNRASKRYSENWISFPDFINSSGCTSNSKGIHQIIEFVTINKPR